MNVKFEVTKDGDIYGYYNHYGSDVAEVYIGQRETKLFAKTLGDVVDFLMSEFNDRLAEDGNIIYNDELMTIDEYKEMME